MSDIFWTPPRTAELIRLWEAGERGQFIADALKAISRSSIMGKIHRLRRAGHVFKRPLKEDDPSERRRISLMGVGALNRKCGREPKPRRAKPNNLAAVNVARRAAGKPRPLPEPPPMLDATHAKPWFDRAFGQCAYPISGHGADTFSCCAPTHGHTYCRAHREVMFATPAPRQAVSPRPIARRFAA